MAHSSSELVVLGESLVVTSVLFELKIIFFFRYISAPDTGGRIVKLRELD